MYCLKDSSRVRTTINVYDALSVLTLMMMVGYFAVTPLRNTTLRHVFVFAGSVAIYGLVLYQLIFWRMNKGEFFRFCVIVALLAGGLVLANSGYFGIIYAHLDFLALFFILSMRIRHEYNIKIKRILYWFSLIVAFLLIVAYFSPAAYVFEDGRSTKSLALGMTNPNLAGMMLTGVIELIVIYYKERKHKVLLAIVAITLLYLAWLTDARSSIVACVCVVVYALFFSKRRIPNSVIYVVVFFSIIFVPAYLMIYRYGLSNVQILGKSLFSGREYTYMEYLSKMDSIEKWFVGDLGGTVFSNAHNAPLMIVSSIGIVGLIAVYSGFLKNLISINNEADNPTRRIAVACILSVCVQSCGEALMFSGIFPSVGFVYIYMLLASNKSDLSSNG